MATAAASDLGTKRQRIERLIQQGDRLANVQQEQQSETSLKPRTSSSCNSSSTCTTSSVFPVRRSSWTPQEDEKLRKLVRQLGNRNWSEIALHFPCRDRKRCRERFVNHLAPSLSSASSTWSAEDDEKLLQLQGAMKSKWVKMAKEFDGKSAESVKNRCLMLTRKAAARSSKEKVAEIGQKWAKVAAFLPGRIGNQCRERFLNHLDPSINTAPWTDAEDKVLSEAIEAHSTQWSLIAENLPGRCENAIKNHWYSRERRRMLAQASSGPPSVTSK
ncbi:hypothetical protein PI126_g8734 [Phytophthora idaei]|nr:hypothetical protein PI126_g8734 [Phytophthora idaei]